jgi:hypothetical protein
MAKFKAAVLARHRAEDRAVLYVQYILYSTYPKGIPKNYSLRPIFILHFSQPGFAEKFSYLVETVQKLHKIGLLVPRVII